MRKVPDALSYKEKKNWNSFETYEERDFQEIHSAATAAVAKRAAAPLTPPASAIQIRQQEASVIKMSVEESEPPQYIVTAPGEERNEDDDDRSSITTTTSTATAQSTGTAISVKTTKAHNTRSQSLQSSSTAVSVGGDQTSALTASLMQQLKASSTVNIVTEKHVQKFSSTQMTTSSSSSRSSAVATGTKSKFTSFLQHPDASSHEASFLTAQQKHVRQFVRSTSAHSSTDSSNTTGISISGKSDKCIRSTSQQIDDDALSSFNTDYSKGLHQSAAILISKSAETIEGFQRSTSSTSNSMRPQLTLSGGFLAPPANRKLTILSPIHAPPGLHEMLKKHRSPLSPRISFPGPEADLFP